MINRFRPSGVVTISVPVAVFDVRFPVGETTVLEAGFVPGFVADFTTAGGDPAVLAGRSAAKPGAFVFPKDLLAPLLGGNPDPPAFEPAPPEFTDRDEPPLAAFFPGKKLSQPIDGYAESKI